MNMLSMCILEASLYLNKTEKKFCLKYANTYIKNKIILIKIKILHQDILIMVTSNVSLWVGRISFYVLRMNQSLACLKKGNGKMLNFNRK